MYLSVRKEEYRPKASGAEKGILKFLLENPEHEVDCSIKQLAQHSFTSPSTVIHLCRKIGFDGYKEFHKALLCELAVRREANNGHQREIQREDSRDAIVQKVTYKNMLSLEKSQKLLGLEI